MKLQFDGLAHTLAVPEVHFPLFYIFEVCSNVTTLKESSLMSQDKIFHLVVDCKNNCNCSLLPSSLFFAMWLFGTLYQKMRDLFPHPLNPNWPCNLHWPRNVAEVTMCCSETRPKVCSMLPFIFQKPNSTSLTSQSWPCWGMRPQGLELGRPVCLN